MKYKMGHVVKIVDISARRIMEYEKIGLIKPLREPKTNDRLFSDFEIRQIKKIKDLIHMHSFTLKSLIYLLNIAPCWKIFSCKNANCAAYLNVKNKCWKSANKIKIGNTGKGCFGDCMKCAIYLASNKIKVMKILEKPKVRKNNKKKYLVELIAK